MRPTTSSRVVGSTREALLEPLCRSTTFHSAWYLAVSDPGMSGVDLSLSRAASVVMNSCHYERSAISSQGAGQADHEAGADVAGNLGSDLTAMQLHDLAADVQAKAHAAPESVSVRLVKALEDLVAPVSRNTQSVIANRHFDASVYP